MQFSGMEELLSKLQKNDVELKKLIALEMFGRSGDWHTTSYASKVKSLEVWEMDSKWKNELEKNLPNAKLRFIDTIKTLAESTTLQKYNFVVIDNPQNLFGPNLPDTNEPQYCEHFDVLQYINKILDDGIVIFNVNLIPYSYDKFPLWKKRRKKFYGDVDTSNMNIDFLLNFYKKFFETNKFKVIFFLYLKRITPNPAETLYYFAYRLKNNEAICT